jgi:hypothetical protein
MVAAVVPRVKLNRPGRPGIIGMIEKQQIDAAAIPREHAEVDPSRDNCGPERETLPTVGTRRGYTMIRHCHRHHVSLISRD